MKRYRIFQWLAIATLVAFVASPGYGRVPKDLAYPTGDVTADEIARQVYFVNHFYQFQNYSIVKDGRTITVLVKKAKDGNPTTDTLERFLNNEYDDGLVMSKDLAIFRSGKLRGTGMLITDFTEDAKSQSYAIWLPALRKIRRFAEPPHDDAWGGSDFTFGDVTLRKPEHETHELLGKESFEDCLGYMPLSKKQRSKWTKDLPEEGSCRPKGREVYKMKSTTKFKNWWYEYRISYVDTKTFADYRSEYFKDGKMIKVIDRDWIPIEGLGDPRAVNWGYWYGKNLETGHETWAYIPQSVIRINDEKLESDLWSEKTLRRIKR